MSKKIKILWDFLFLPAQCIQNLSLTCFDLYSSSLFLFLLRPTLLYNFLFFLRCSLIQKSDLFFREDEEILSQVKQKVNKT
jgi:hypothetical protein